MHISDVNTTTHRSERLKNAGVGHTEPAAPSRPTTEEGSETQADRVEISNDARNASSRSEEVAFARNALHNVPEMSAERTAQIKDRIQSGYYSSPDVLKSVAERMFS